MNHSSSSLQLWLEREIGVEIFTPNHEVAAKIFSPLANKISKKSIKIVTIGGTNGKGETCFNLGQIFKENETSFGLWSSPHINCVTERFVIDDTRISIKELWALFQEHKAYSKKLSYYEFLFFIFLQWVLSKDNLKYLILEVGLGGRLDAVNYLSPSLTAIVSIGRDHENILGRGYKNILNEKLGITRPEVPLLCGDLLDYCNDIVTSFCKTNKTPVYSLAKLGIVNHRDNYSKKNNLLAFSLFYFLKNSQILPENFLRKEAENFNFKELKGRDERMTRDGKSFIFIGAHNLAGLQAMLHRVKEACNVNKGLFAKRMFVSFSDRPDKDIINQLKLIANLAKFFDEIIITSFSHNRAISSLSLERLLNQAMLGLKEKIKFEKNWKQYIQEKNSESNFFTGSYYFISEVQKNI